MHTIMNQSHINAFLLHRSSCIPGASSILDPRRETRRPLEAPYFPFFPFPVPPSPHFFLPLLLLLLCSSAPPILQSSSRSSRSTILLPSSFPHPPLTRNPYPNSIHLQNPWKPTMKPWYRGTCLNATYSHSLFHHLTDSEEVEGLGLCVETYLGDLLRLFWM